MFYLHNTRGWLWLCLLLWDYSFILLCTWLFFASLFWNVPQVSSGKKQRLLLLPYLSLSLWCLPLVLHVLVTVGLLWQTPWPKAPWGEKALFLLTTLRSHSIAEEVRKGTWRQNWSKNHRGMLPAGLLSLLAQAALFYSDFYIPTSVSPLSSHPSPCSPPSPIPPLFPPLIQLLFLW